MSTASEQLVLMGRITGYYGIKGWVKVFSDTSPRDAIMNYRFWQLKGVEGWQTVEIENGRMQGKGVIVKVVGYDDRDQSAALIGSDIAVDRDLLPKLSEDEFYWADLNGLDVYNAEGIHFGKVDHLFETGANDVICVKGKGKSERLIPWIKGRVVMKVDLENSRIDVDWDADF